MRAAIEPDFVEECLSVLTRTPATLDALLGDLPDAWTAATEGPGTWSPFVVIGHLILGIKARAEVRWLWFHRRSLPQ